jgi:hypothetical protein
LSAFEVAFAEKTKEDADKKEEDGAKGMMLYASPLL